MSKSDACKEKISSQIPALQLLLALGYQYFTPTEALAARGGKERIVALMVVIECKRHDLNTSSSEKAVTQAITQMIRNQQPDEIPGLFIYSQLLLALSQYDAH